MRVLITTSAALLLAAAAATALALHAPLGKSAQAVQAPQAPAGIVATDAVPGIVWRSGTATLRLTDRPCPSEDLTLAVETEGVTKARAYEVQQGSRHYTGCWTKDISGDVVTMEPGRDVGSIPIGWFRKNAG